MDLQTLEANVDQLPDEELRQMVDALEQRCRESDDELWARCKTHPWFFVRRYCRSINLHNEEAMLAEDAAEVPEPSIDLFPDYPHVRILVEELARPRNAIIEKSRDMMATWTIAAIFLYDLMFSDGAPLMMASKTFNDVDDGGPESTPDSLLGRVRFMYEQLPDWMHNRALCRFKKGLVLNESNDAFIRGLKAVRNTGRGGKYRRALADEFGFWDYGEANLASLRYACMMGLILLSTPPREGRHHAYGRIATAGEGYFDKITLHWSLHPERDREWYVEAGKDMTDEEIARELDISYTGAVSGRVYPMFDTERHVVPDIPYRSDLPLYLTFDHGLNEETCLFIQVDDDGRALIIDEYQGGKNTDETDNAGIKNLTPWDHRKALLKRLINEPYNLVIGPDGRLHGLAGAYGDPTGQVEDLPNIHSKGDDTKLTSAHAVYGAVGINIVSSFTKQIEGIQIVRDELQREKNGIPMLVIAERCSMTWDAFIHHRRKKRPGTEEYTDSVVEDWTKHAMDAVRYFYINRTSMAAHRRQGRRRYKQVWVPSPTGARYPKLVPV